MVALDGQDLVVPLVAEVEAGVAPGVDVVGKGDGAAGALVAAHRPELLKGLGAVDGGLVVAGADQDVVGAAVRGEGPAVGGARRRVVAAKALHHVVLDQRVARPAVDGQV